MAYRFRTRNVTYSYTVNRSFAHGLRFQGAATGGGAAGVTPDEWHLVPRFESFGSTHVAAFPVMASINATSIFIRKRVISASQTSPPIASGHCDIFCSINHSIIA